MLIVVIEYVLGLFIWFFVYMKLFKNVLLKLNKIKIIIIDYYCLMLLFKESCININFM